ncbi:MAG TPA: hypothetical protein VNG33_07110, partial [Polyangiaceae bacterium]|nr:hypothetical protein [Polyangiaceae bacterium]
SRVSGVQRPWSGSVTPTLCGLGVLAALSVGCNAEDQQESLPTLQVGMSCTRGADGGCVSNVPAIFDDGETQIYEVKKGLAFPILAPTDVTRGQLNKIDAEPYGRQPWVTTDDIDVQVTWTISNLDEEQHVVELLVDPWNEFGRYFPGLQLTDPEEQKYMPNFSGIDKRYIVEGKYSGESSRAHGTYTFSDLAEVATDFATVMDLIKNPPMLLDPSGDPDKMEDPTVIYTNHAFHWQNRSYNDLLVKPWVPTTIAGLTGLDLGFRTYEPVNVAIEVEVEIVDKNGSRLRQKGDEDKPLLKPSNNIITVGVAPP